MSASQNRYMKQTKPNKRANKIKTNKQTKPIKMYLGLPICHKIWQTKSVFCFLFFHCLFVCLLLALSLLKIAWSSSNTVVSSRGFNETFPFNEIRTYCTLYLRLICISTRILGVFQQNVAGFSKQYFSLVIPWIWYIYVNRMIFNIKLFSISQ